jgi:thiol-disulfide isomerase/thioredoxin
MLKLFTITLLLSSLVEASSVSNKIEIFLQKTYGANPNIKSINVKVTNKVPVKGRNDWSAYIVEVNAVLKKDKRKIAQKMIWFSNGDLIAKDLFDLDSGVMMNDLIKLEFKDEYYREQNLIYGNPNARNKIAIFSDPLCPFCRNFVPKVINDMKNEPNKYAIYYYHFPLPSLHPAGVELVKAAIALELKGRKDVILDLYKVKVDPREKSVKKILAAFNKVMNSNIKTYDLQSKEVREHVKADLEIADALMVNGTPTVFFNGKLDKTKTKYKEAK